MGYITNFIVYTLAMVGVIVVALLVFKNATTVGGGKSSKYLKIIDSISLGQRKNLFIVSTGKEQFLIAGDVSNTCLISKLDNVGVSTRQDNEDKNMFENINSKTNSFKDTLESLPYQGYMDKSNIGIKSCLLDNKNESSVMKSLAERIKM